MAQNRNPSNTRQFLLGMGSGFIPMILFLITFGLWYRQFNSTLGNLLVVSLVLYIIELITTIIFLANNERRFVGYGLLTAFLASPVISAIACSVGASLIHPV